MKKVSFVVFLLLSIQLNAQEKSLESLLPTTHELKGFELKGESEYYQGDDLFYLINGGADIYLEYGFKDVISASYANKTGQGFKVEIYQMLNDSAAYGIFSFNRNDKAIYHDLGDASIRQDDFLIFIKGPYYVILTTQSNQKAQEINLLEKARIIISKLKVSGKLPALVAEYDQLAPNAIYLRGNLALSNIYLFDFSDIFHFSDGLHFRNNDVSTFIINYPSPNVCELTFQKVKIRLQNSTRFQYFEEKESGFSLSDKNEQVLVFTSSKNKIYIFLSKEEKNIEDQMNIVLK